MHTLVIMPWWSWIVIWIALIALSLLYVVLLGIKLWGHVVRLGNAVSDVSAAFSARSVLLRQDASPVLATFVRQEAPGQLELPAVTEAVEVYHRGKVERRAARRRRRIERRRRHGQAQSLRDLREEGPYLTR